MGPTMDDPARTATGLLNLLISENIIENNDQAEMFYQTASKYTGVDVTKIPADSLQRNHPESMHVLLRNIDTMLAHIKKVDSTNIKLKSENRSIRQTIVNKLQQEQTHEDYNITPRNSWTPTTTIHASPVKMDNIQRSRSKSELISRPSLDKIIRLRSLSQPTTGARPRLQSVSIIDDPRFTSKRHLHKQSDSVKMQMEQLQELKEQHERMQSNIKM
ncbi:hypothetical protein AKO1_008099 [Acrasis kona]|uniref:Uncharacterized protein n=1 Tax=Acrasis kona TaxID=1008807 RepID=A0AAW2YRL5_9EUKA